MGDTTPTGTIGINIKVTSNPHKQMLIDAWQHTITTGTIVSTMSMSKPTTSGNACATSIMIHHLITSLDQSLESSHQLNINTKFYFKKREYVTLCAAKTLQLVSSFMRTCLELFNLYSYSIYCSVISNPTVRTLF